MSRIDMIWEVVSATLKDGPHSAAATRTAYQLAQDLERIIIDGADCPAHGAHPHNGMVCLDCAACFPRRGKVAADVPQ